MNININQAEELYKLGFTFKHYQENIHKGMVFYYNNNELIIGGNSQEDLSDSDLEVVRNGIWLPSSWHLFEWLRNNDFAFYIKYEGDLIELFCKDSMTGREYLTNTLTLDYTLSCTIRKILKKKEREFDKNEIIIAEIIED